MRQPCGAGRKLMLGTSIPGVKRLNCLLRKVMPILIKTMGTYLMNFYNGIENILKRICKEYYLILPKGESWHKELLILSYKPPEGKIPIFNRETIERLAPYRNFRHRFVSGYGFQLNGEKMLDLIDNIDPLWIEIKKSINEFLERI